MEMRWSRGDLYAGYSEVGARPAGDETPEISEISGVWEAGKKVEETLRKSCRQQPVDSAVYAA